VTLTVRDAAGQAGTLTQNVIVTADPVLTVHLASASGSALPKKTSWTATVTVTVQDKAGRDVAGATVTGAWSTGATSSCVTNATGTCSSSLNLGRKTTSVTWTVTGITAAGYTYDAGADVGSPVTVAP
jgi:hypothetical protein